MPLNTQIDVKNPSAFTIRNHAFGVRPSTAAAPRSKADTQPTPAVTLRGNSKPA